MAIFAYLIMAGNKLYFAHLFQSASLQSDGLNNLSDIIGSVSIFIGLYIANRPPDANHRFGHLKYEAIASFFAAMLMFSIGFDLFKTTIFKMYTSSYQETHQQAVYVGIFSAIFLSLVRYFIYFLTRKNLSIGLKASLADMKNDIYISLSTSIGTLFVIWGMPWVDLILSLTIACLIIQSAFNIFKESTFLLSDGFDQALLQSYREIILKHPKVRQVRQIRGRFY